MIHEKSAGAVVFYGHGTDIEYLLLLYGAGHWDFPKGNIEKGEQELDTVRREVWEETGIKDIEVIPGFKRRIRYYYRREGALVHKEVIFYLVRALTKEVKLSREHKDYVWLGYENALRRLTFKTAKKTLSEAHRFLSSRLALS